MNGLLVEWIDYMLNEWITRSYVRIRFDNSFMQHIKNQYQINNNIYTYTLNQRRKKVKWKMNYHPG